MFFTPVVIVFTLFLLANTQSTTTTTSITTTFITTIYNTTTNTATQSPTPTQTLTPDALLKGLWYPSAPRPAVIDQYLASITIQSQYTAAEEAYQSALPEDLKDQPGSFGPFSLWPVADGKPDWMSAMPASDVMFISSVIAEEVAILSKAREGSAPTNRPRMELVGAAVAAGAALAAGAAGLAMS